MPLMQNRTYYLGGETVRRMDGVSWGQPCIKVEIDMPECIDVDENFLAEVEMLFSEIRSIFR